jgi:hypothetical protein
MRQSMPSSNIDSWAGVRETRPRAGDRSLEVAFLKAFAEQAKTLPVEPKQFSQPPRLPRKAAFARTILGATS